ncbi:hypothetical protein VZT92_022264 [Zoarces viviparus]|uniref:Uncharacterized protein n=1 Tax=Zoarces viviparus TaxID=48416 RepID=A0AAW1ECK0_ZOAVI
MPGAGSAATGAAAAAAVGGATAAGDGTESSRHRHRAQQGEAERPEPGAAPSQGSSGVLGESSTAYFAFGRCGLGKRIKEERTGGRDGERDEYRTIIHLAAPFFCLHEGVPKVPLY